MKKFGHFIYVAGQVLLAIWRSFFPENPTTTQHTEPAVGQKRRVWRPPGSPTDEELAEERRQYV